MSSITIGQMNQLGDSMQKAGFTTQDVTKLGQDKKILRMLLRLLRGELKIKFLERLIDCEIAPFIPNSWLVEEHQKGGQFIFNPTKVELYVSKNYKNNQIYGNDLREELKGRQVMNANVLDFLLAHPELIPDAWEVKHVFFFGTIYRRRKDGWLHVRYLYFNGLEWESSWRWLGFNFNSSCPIAVAS